MEEKKKTKVREEKEISLQERKRDGMIKGKE